MNRYEVTFAVPGPNLISLTSGTELELKSNFNFIGNGVTVERPGGNQVLFRLFQVNANTESFFTNMTFQNGFAGSTGGAINDYGALHVLNCTFINNHANMHGGAICVTKPPGGDATVDITGCTLELNTALISGGAVAVSNGKSVTITASTIFENEVTGTAAGQGYGGGVYIANAQTVTINSSTAIVSNHATEEGGGISIIDTAGVMIFTMTNSVINGNWTEGEGGGFFVDAAGDTLTFTNVTVTNNAALGMDGGGGFVESGTLKGSLAHLTGNSDFFGVNGRTAGIAYVADKPDLIVPAGEQEIVKD